MPTVAIGSLADFLPHTTWRWSLHGDSQRVFLACWAGPCQRVLGVTGPSVFRVPFPFLVVPLLLLDRTLPSLSVCLFGLGGTREPANPDDDASAVRHTVDIMTARRSCRSVRTLLGRLPYLKQNEEVIRTSRNIWDLIVRKIDCTSTKQEQGPVATGQGGSECVSDCHALCV